ncbi:MAG: hypothetical protein MJZ19_08285 [Paludibacteraceae bacterium]|nr:hypothetical protein [Paludibacteraceae bacterium]
MKQRLLQIGATIFVATLFISLMSLSSCYTKEEKVISRLETLSQKIEQNSNDFNEADWESALNDLEEINNEMQSCAFTQEQMKEVGKMYGKLSSKVAKEMGNKFYKAIKNYGSFLSGFKDGLGESISEEDIKNVSNEITDALNNVENLFKEE